MPPKLKKILANYNRCCLFRQEEINKESRTVPIALSSEEPYKRFYGTEILGHEQGEVDLEWLNSGRAPLLLNHNFDQQIGVVEKAWLDSDKVCRCIPRFGNSTLAQEIFNDVIDGIRQNVSVGYEVREIKFLDKSEENYRATNWKPYEVSIVSVPADTTVGVGRGRESEEEQEEKDMKDKSVNTEADQAEINVELVRSEAMSQERKRIADITELGRTHGQEELAVEYVRSGKHIESFRTALLEKIATKPIQNVVPQDSGFIGMNKKEAERYSLRAAILALATEDWTKAGFERECNQEVTRLLGRTPRKGGVFVPNDVRSGFAVRTAQGMSAAADLVPQMHRGDLFIDELKQALVFARLGATVLNGLRGIVHIPKKVTSPAVQTVADGNAATEGAYTWGTVELKPHTASANIPYTRTLLNQSDPSIDALIRADINQNLMIHIENKGINGDGDGDEVKGLLATTGINTVEFATANKPTFLELVEMEEKLINNKALLGKLQYLIDGPHYKNCKTTAKDAGSGQFLLTGNREKGELNGYPFQIATWLPSETMVFGNWAELIVALFDALEIIVEQSATTGQTTIGIFQDYDVAVRHAVSFCKGYKPSSS